MQTAVKVALAGAAALTALGVGLAVAKSASAAPPAAPGGATPTPGVPPQGSTVWVRAMALEPGQRVRISLPAGALAQIPGMPSVDLAGFEALLGTPTVVDALGATNFNTWGPGATLPADWPPDDVDAATEFHADFTYAAAAAALNISYATILVSALPIPGLLAWVPKGTGA